MTRLLLILSLAILACGMPVTGKIHHLSDSALTYWYHPLRLVQSVPVVPNALIEHDGERVMPDEP